MKKLLTALATLFAVAALEGTAHAGGDVTICHAAGRADEPANWVTLTLPWQAVYGEAGHFYENGTPQAGHEQDYLGECDTDDTTTTTTTVVTSTTAPATTAPATTAPATTAPATTAPATTLPAVTTAPTTAPPAPAPPPALPTTGNETWVIAALAAAFTAAGWGVTRLARR
jgi:hypothetical protein